MLLEIYHKTTRERIDIIRTFTFVQYTDFFNDVGTFNIKVPVKEKSLDNLKKDNYILFDKDVLGVIKYIHKQSLTSPVVEIRGFMISHILGYRSFLTTKEYSGPIFEIERQMVNDMFIESEDSRRNIKFIDLAKDYPNSNEVSIQITGEKVLNEIMYLNGPRGYGFDLIPAMQKYDDNKSKSTNISSFVFVNRRPYDRTKRNKVGNSPVVFSVEMNNLSDLMFEQDSTEYCSTAIVAGEGEGEDRRIVEAGNTTVSGIDRIELYVDARDIQSEKEDGYVVPDEKYISMLTQRGLESLKDNDEYINFEGTAIMGGNTSYVYGESFFKGDYVTIEDRDLGLEFDLQITGVKKSLTEKGEITDLIFGTEKISVYKRVKKVERGVIYG